MAVLDSINAAKQWLEQALRELAELQAPQIPATLPDLPNADTPVGKIAWGSKVSPTFKARLLWTADALGCDPNHLMACMAWESAESFRSDKKNAAGSGAVGLIQFMPSTARSMGISTDALSALSPEDQLRYVYEYFKGYAGRLHNLGDVYMAILWPKGIGQPDSYVLFDKSRTPTTFRQNAGLDVNHNGAVTRGECLVKINEKLAKGLLPQNAG
jgi:hypothetical protein